MVTALAATTPVFKNDLRFVFFLAGISNRFIASPFAAFDLLHDRRKS
jgi:hypothetical protein